MAKPTVLCSNTVRGRVRGGLVLPVSEGTPTHDIDGSGIPRVCWLPGQWDCLRRGWKTNLVVRDWTGILAELLRNAPDGRGYHPAGMYIEFENNAGAEVVPPTFDRDGTIAYYAGLSTDPARDYLRVPLTAVTLTNSDEAVYDYANRLSFFAQTEGLTGVHGKAFNDVVQSRVYGGALVAFPEYADPTQDRVFSRFYFDDADEQMIKLSGSQIGLQWQLTVE